MESLGFKCSHQGCERVYTTAFNLRRHIESYHLGLRNFICGICNKGLSSRQNLREHLFIHEGTKPYQCNFPGCPETFRQLSQLKVHEKFHIVLKKNISEKFNVDFSVFQRSLLKFQLEELADEPLGEIPELEELGKKILVEFEKISNSSLA